MEVGLVFLSAQRYLTYQQQQWTKHSTPQPPNAFKTCTIDLFCKCIHVGSNFYHRLRDNRGVHSDLNSASTWFSTWFSTPGFENQVEIWVERCWEMWEVFTIRYLYQPVCQLCSFFQLVGMMCIILRWSNIFPLHRLAGYISAIHVTGEGGVENELRNELRTCCASGGATLNSWVETSSSTRASRSPSWESELRSELRRVEITVNAPIHYYWWLPFVGVTWKGRAVLPRPRV